MTRQQWQKKHGFTDEEMATIALLRKIFKAQSIVVIEKKESKDE